MKRVIVLVDGLNLYHAIDNHPNWHGFKWLNLKSLANALIMPSQETVIEICFFTSVPTWNLNKHNRHRTLLRVYADLGIRIIEGKIRRADRKCRASCEQTYIDHEEKQTDINIAIEMLRAGMEDRTDKVILITADSDQIPAIRIFREKFPAKELMVAVPPGEDAEEICGSVTKYAQINLGQLKRSLIDDPYTTKDGTIIPKPPSWMHKTIYPPRSP
ncbi:MAG: NYN domain-containing protein [Opitutaceae bacterium]